MDLKLEQQDTPLKSAATIWLTGLSGAGKSTLAEALKARLDDMLQDAKKSFILDGDVIRRGLNKNLGFSQEDRAENIRRIAEVSKLFNIAGQIAITAFISPYAADREAAKALHTQEGYKFFEIFVNSPLEVCEKRDVKGLYKKARAGEIKNFTGISDPYEAPEHPDFVAETATKSVDECVDDIINFLYKQDVLNKNHFFDSEIDLLLQDTYDINGITHYLDLDREHVEYLQVLSEGWCHPLRNFMNEE